MTATQVDLGLDLDRFHGHDIKAELLRLNLSLAVPLRIAQYQQEQRSAEWLIEHARHLWGEHCAGVEHESLLYASKARTVRGVKYPGTAQVFNWFAEVVACAALVADGGITLFGLHFDAEVAQ